MAADLIFRGQRVGASAPRLVIAISFLLATVHCYAEELSDPTQPPSGIYGASNGQDAALERKIISPSNNGLQSIIISPERRAAIINGKTVELGETIGRAKLVEVSESGVVLQNAGSRRVLALFPGVNLTIKTSTPTQLEQKDSKSSNEAIEHAVPEEKK